MKIPQLQHLLYFFILTPLTLSLQAMQKLSIVEEIAGEVEQFNQKESQKPPRVLVPMDDIISYKFLEEDTPKVPASMANVSLKFLAAHKIAQSFKPSYISETPRLPLELKKYISIFDIDTSSQEKITPVRAQSFLIEACKKGELGNDLLQDLLIVHPNLNVNLKDNWGAPIHYAAKNQHYTVMDFLIEQGASVGSITNDKETVLITLLKNLPAILLKHLPENENAAQEKMVQKLINMGVSIDAADKEGNTALIFACNKLNIPIIKLLLANSANVSATNKNNNDALWYAAFEISNLSRRCVENFSTNRVEAIKEKIPLLSLLKDTLSVRNGEASSTSFSCYKAFDATFDHYYFSHRFTDTYFGEPKRIVISEIIVPVVRFFLNNKNFFNHHSDLISKKLLGVGTYEHSKELFALGLEYKVPVSNDTLTDIIEYSDNKHLALVLQNNPFIHGFEKNDYRRFKTTPFELAAKKRNFEALKLFAKNGIDINQIIYYGSDNLLETAIIKNDRELIELLVELNCDFNAPPYDYEKYKEYGGLPNSLYNGLDMPVETPLRLAIKNNKTDIVRLLLKGGANPNITTKEGDDALLAAVKLAKPKKEVIQLLLEYGANANNKDKRGFTALDHSFRAIGILPPFAQAPEIIPLLLSCTEQFNEKSHISLEVGGLMDHNNIAELNNLFVTNEKLLKPLLDKGLHRSLYALTATQKCVFLQKFSPHIQKMILEYRPPAYFILPWYKRALFDTKEFVNNNRKPLLFTIPCAAALTGAALWYWHKK